MAHLIDKDALVAEIERRIESCAKQREDMLNVQCYTLADDASARMGELNCIQDFLDTLEVKEVDLEREIQMFSMDLATKENNGDWDKDIAVTAKHFFELGLKAQKGKEVDLEKDVRQILSLYYEGIKHYEDTIKEEREENGGSDLAIKIMDGVVDARELGIQYVIDKLKAQKGEL